MPGIFENASDIKAMNATFYEIHGNLYHTGNDNGGSGFPQAKIIYITDPPLPRPPPTVWMPFSEALRHGPTVRGAVIGCIIGCIVVFGPIKHIYLGKT